MQIEAIEKRAVLSDLALERIVEVIMRGDLKPGERVQEAVLARQLGISRGPLREAISRLEGRHLIVRIPHVGVRIADPSKEEILDIFSIREALEGVACRLAAERMTQEELDEVVEILTEHSAQSDVFKGDGYYQRSGDRDFHYKIITGARSARLSDLLLGDLYQFLRVFRYRSSAAAGRAKRAHKEHLAIASALQKRDPDAADAAMRKHLRNARTSLEQSFAERESGEG